MQGEILKFAIEQKKKKNMQSNKGSIIRGRQLLVNGRPFFIRGAEIQYFRLPKETWEKHLKQAKACGINTISACMSWHLHEPIEGQFDFVGRIRPERDLVRFMEMVAEYDLKLIAHPGPFMNCEFRTGGIPEWLFREYPETMSRRADGRIATGRPIPAEGEPLYREYVKRWYDAVVPLFAKFQADRGGPIILFQPDNELSAAWSFGLLNSLYDPHVVSTLWPRWLSQKYRSIGDFNEISGTRFSKFEDIAPPAGFPDSAPTKRLSYDWLEFKRRFFADWGAHLANLAKERGMNTPFIFNEPVAGFYGHGDHAGFGNALKDKGVEGATVIHNYSDRIFDLDGLVHSLMGIELMKSSPWGGPLISLETNCNWFVPRCSRSAINWSPLLRSNLAHGLTGFSVFTYSEALTDLGDSINGPEYFPNTCLDVSARPSNANAHVEDFIRLVDTWEDSLHALETIRDVTVAYSPAMRILDFLGAPPCLGEGVPAHAAPGGGSFDTEPGLNREALSVGHDWLDGYENVSKQTISPEAGLWLKMKEVFALLSRLNLQFDLLDLTNPSKRPGDGCLIVPCTGTLEKESMDYLLAHIEEGGRCVFFPTIPVRTTLGEDDLRLAERLGISLVEQIRPAGSETLRYGSQIVNLANGDVLTEPGWVFVHHYPEGTEILATLEKKPVLAQVGNVLVSGIDVRFTTGATLKFWESALIEKMKVPATIKSSGNYYYASLLGTPQKGLLTVVNITGDTSPGELTLPGADISMTLELGATEARVLPIHIELDGVPLCYSTSEIRRTADGQSYELHGSAGTRACLAFACPVCFEMDGNICKTQPKGDLFVFEFRHPIHPGKISRLRSCL